MTILHKIDFDYVKRKYKELLELRDMARAVVDDEAILNVLNTRQQEFNAFAHESSIGDASKNLVDKDWIREYILREQRRYIKG